jgi:nitroreductase
LNTKFIIVTYVVDAIKLYVKKETSWWFVCFYYTHNRTSMEYDLTSQLHRRYATKQFDTEKKIPKEQFDQLLQSLRLSPSSFWLQGWWFVVVESKDLREQLKPYSRDQPQVIDASHLVVLCRTTKMDTDRVNKYIEKVAKVRWIPLENLDGFKNMMLSHLEGKSDEEIANRLTKQVYIAQWFFLSACAQLQIDACPMEWFDLKKYDEILWLEKDGLASCVIIAAWYRHVDDPYAWLSKVRFDFENIVSRK